MILLLARVQVLLQVLTLAGCGLPIFEYTVGSVGKGVVVVDSTISTYRYDHE
jgi:hypothetical protein